MSHCIYDIHDRMLFSNLIKGIGHFFLFLFNLNVPKNITKPKTQSI